VSPLTWSHATVVIACIEYAMKHAQLSGAARPGGRRPGPGGGVAADNGAGLAAEAIRLWQGGA
jgi:hypothetical protein